MSDKSDINHYLTSDGIDTDREVERGGGVGEGVGGAMPL